MPLADGPAMYFGGSIMTFALPYGAFIVIAVALYFLFRAKHSGPKLKYGTTASVASFTTREPGPVPAPSVTGAHPETPAAPAATAAPDPGGAAAAAPSAEAESEQ
jgi:hypothetical protein